MLIRPFQPTDADYEAFVTINNVNWQDNPITVESEKQADATRHSDYFFRRLVGEISGKIVATGECGATFWLDEADQYYWHYNFLPDYANQGYEELMHDHLLAEIAPQNPRKYFVGMRDDKVHQIEFIEARGYHLIQTEQTSFLDVGTFDSTSFGELLSKIQQMGIQFHSLAHLHDTDPDWLRKLWDLQWAIRQDIPMATQVTREPFAEFEKTITDPTYDLTVHFVAVHNTPEKAIGDYIGMTHLTYNQVDPTIGATHLTGVVRSFRRKGIATALKVHAITRAKAQGVRRIYTMNNETNPMLDLNLRLGFQQGPAWRYYDKVV